MWPTTFGTADFQLPSVVISEDISSHVQLSSGTGYQLWMMIVVGWVVVVISWVLSVVVWMLAVDVLLRVVVLWLMGQYTDVLAT